ncbi:MAG TPA: stage V sporulation protein AE [Clostridiales bacterium]|nr:stage V sporulation protein AE [Clostridiales bacterium]
MSELLLAFAVGGAMCLLAQLVLDISRLTPAHVMVAFVSLGAVASGMGLYEFLVDLGGAGALIPLPAFGHALVQGIVEEVAKEGPIGLLTGGMRAVALGLTVAVLSGLAMALLFDPRG